mgnify:FL=1
MKRSPPGNERLAVAYLRVSTEDQRLGPEAQKHDCELWARQQGVGIVETFIDQGVSGGAELENRPNLLAALAALRQHGAGVLLIAKRDRLARDVAVAALIERSVKSAGARVVTADGIGNGEGPADQLVRTVIDGAAYERAVIKGRTKAALAAKVRRGERIGQIPYGFRLKEQGPRNDRGFPILLEPDPQEQALLERIKACPGLSLRKLRALLLAEGYRNRRGKAIKVTQFQRLRHRLAREGAHAPGGAV